jgi:hypothetical protein
VGALVSLYPEMVSLSTGAKNIPAAAL